MAVNVREHLSKDESILSLVSGWDLAYTQVWSGFVVSIGWVGALMAGSAIALAFRRTQGSRLVVATFSSMLSQGLLLLFSVIDKDTMFFHYTGCAVVYWLAC